MKLNTQIIVFLFVLIFIACDKTPLSNFTTDKEEYIAGETVKLTNTSLNAVNYVWTMPNSETTIEKDATYTIDENIGSMELPFKLDSKSKGGKKKDSKIKNVTIIPCTSFKIINGASIYEFKSHSISISSSNGWLVLANYHAVNDNYYAFIRLSFYNNSPPQLGTYQLTTSSPSLTSNQCVALIQYGYPDAPISFVSTSGQMIFDNINGKRHFKFDTISSQLNGYKMSGEIFLPSNL